MAARSGRVHRRRVLYVAGYDPASPKKYHRIWTEHAPRQGALNGVRYDIGELKPLDDISTGWRITAEHPGGERVEIDYVFLHWFDLVRAVWPKEGPTLLLRTFRAFFDYHRAHQVEPVQEDVVDLHAFPARVLGGDAPAPRNTTASGPSTLPAKGR